MIPHPEWRALSLAVCERPDDDTARLVAADWLDEHGYADRAAFIRLQIAYDRLPPRPPRCRRKGGAADYCDAARCPACAARREYDTHRSQLYDRAHALEAAHGAGWCGFPVRPGWGIGRKRGFVQAVSLTLGEFLRHAEALFRAEPLTWVTPAGVAPFRPEVPPPARRHGEWQPRWAWARGRRRTGRGPTLPDELFDRLPGRHGGDDYREYPDWNAARNALNAACVALGRERAGLPAWVPPKL